MRFQRAIQIGDWISSLGGDRGQTYQLDRTLNYARTALFRSLRDQNRIGSIWELFYGITKQIPFPTRCSDLGLDKWQVFFSSSPLKAVLEKCFVTPENLGGDR